VTWIKASLNVPVSEQLWEDFLNVLSSLTGWIQLIREWAVRNIIVIYDNIILR